LSAAIFFSLLIFFDLEFSCYHNNPLFKKYKELTPQMQCRKPIVAGRFYPNDKDDCLAEIKTCIEEGAFRGKLPEKIVAGIVPHAGWFFSGSVAAMVFSAIKKQNGEVDSFVIFGTAHSYFGSTPAVYDKGCWQTPLGQILIDEELAQTVLKTGLGDADCAAHNAEHSIEVQIPFIQFLFPDSKILPVIVPPAAGPVRIGEAIGDIIGAESGKKIVCIGSTDLTHYGPGYDFTPMGTGPEAIEWASNVNDRQFIDSAVALEPERLLNESAENGNACGPGAAAAAIAAAKNIGCKKGLLLVYTNSSTVCRRKMNRTSSESVGYAAIIF
jgi:MEMO1 family protein